MQINDPARDLAWIFAKLDEAHRNAVLAAYGRMLGNRLDDLIMLRANLWLQMEQVGEFVQALSRADNAKILQFKAQVERLAHQLGVMTQRAKDTAAPAQRSGTKPPSTITVGTLLNDAERRRASEPSTGRPPAETVASETAVNDDTGETDKTGSSQIEAVGEADVDSTADHPVTAHTSGSTAQTVVFSGSVDTDDDTGEAEVRDVTAQTEAAPSHDAESTATIVIPLLEREERAMRDAQAGLHPDEDDDTGERTPRA